MSNKTLLTVRRAQLICNIVLLCLFAKGDQTSFLYILMFFVFLWFANLAACMEGVLKTEERILRKDK